MDAYIGEIRAFSFDYVPEGWVPCDGTIYPINMSQALASLLGAKFGGDGRTTFGVPNLSARIPFGNGVSDYGILCTFADYEGASLQTLAANQIPYHSHTARFAPAPTVPLSVTVAVADVSTGQVPNPAGNYLAQSSGNVETYAAPGTTPPATLAGATLTPTGGTGTVVVSPAGAPNPSPVDIIPSHVAMRFFICIEGEYPVRP